MRAFITSDDGIQFRVSASSIPQTGVLPLIPIQVQYVALGQVQPRRSTSAHYVAASRHVNIPCRVDTRLDTPIMGLTERLGVLAGFQWTFVLALKLFLL